MEFVLSSSSTSNGGHVDVSPLSGVIPSPPETPAENVALRPSRRSGRHHAAKSSAGRAISAIKSMSESSESSSSLIPLQSSESTPPTTPSSPSSPDRLSFSPAPSALSAPSSPSSPSAPSSPSSPPTPPTRLSPTPPPPYDMHVDDERYSIWTKLSKNYSPFDARLFYPLITLTPPTDRLTICLDMDETLIHSSTARPDPAGPAPDFTFTIGPTGGSVTVYTWKRPGLDEFLDYVFDKFEVVLYTASQSIYAIPIINHIDPKGRFTGRILMRQHCAEIDTAKVKDLSLLGRSLDRIFLLDNSPVAYLFQPRNGVPIKTWMTDQNDTELMKIRKHLLEHLAGQGSIYDVIDTYNCCHHTSDNESYDRVRKFVEQNSRNGKIGARSTTSTSTSALTR